MPQEIVSGPTPAPRNDSEASAMITIEMLSVARITIEFTTLGSRWRVISRKSDAPIVRAARTNSRSRRLSTSARTSRA